MNAVAQQKSGDNTAIHPFHVDTPVLSEEVRAGFKSLRT